MNNFIENIAINEILNPSLELTLQFLKVCPVIIKSESPVIEDIIYSKDGDYAEVYFQLENEDYYLVVYIDLTPELSLRTVGTSAGNYVDLIVTSDNEDVENLISIVGINPKRKWNEGERKGKSENRHEESGFIFRLNEKMTGEVEDKISQLLDFIFARGKEFKNLSKIASLDISIFYCGYKDQMWGVNLSKETIKRLSEFDLSLDIDVYASGADLE
ncbi:MAG: DUF4279 domain-containing protein [Clostridiaceae bacterium]|nr:DUF4279 domain-containing protein [Clostridiaceae bacterium]